MRVLVVDDHELILRGLCDVIDGHYGFQVTGTAGSAAAAVQACADGAFDIVIMDISLPDRNGLEAMKDILASHPDLRVLILSIHSEDQYALRALRDGAAGYLMKDSAADELLEAVRTVASGKRYISTAMSEHLSDLVINPDDRLPHERLSDREFEVLRLIAEGHTSGQISETLNLSVKTISTYRTRTLLKLGLSTNSELTHYAFKNGLVD